MRILIKNGQVLDPSQNLDACMDVLIEDGIIAAVRRHINEPADQIIDAQGLAVMPGFIDLHVHFREPGFEYKETIATGSQAAARGGFTSVCPMPNTKPVIDSVEMIRYLKEKEKNESVVHILPVGAVTKNQAGKEVTDIPAMVEEGMVAISEDGKSVMDSAVYAQAMKLAAKEKITVLAHCEDKNLVRGGVMNAGSKAESLGLNGITNAVEDIIVARDIQLAKETGAKLHLCHCSTKDSVQYIRQAKEWGVQVSGEVCPHHFTLCDEDIPGDDANYKMNPPLRSREDVEALKKALKDNIMEAISTDHAPHSTEEKNQSIAKAPFGIVGLETAFALAVTELVDTGYLTKLQLVERMSTSPARIIGIEKGTLKPGSAADVVIADFEQEYQIDKFKFASKGTNTPFHNKTVHGCIQMTFVDGKMVYHIEKKEVNND
ncbi:MAG: dihydroorotase [Clostridiales bacterium]|nr:dihydroorotase [Clostridiales bacterium]